MSAPSIVSLIALLALSGCGVTAVAVKPELPLLPSAATSTCARPIAKLKGDLGVIALRWKATAVCESGKRAALITFYGELRQGLSAKQGDR